MPIAGSKTHYWDLPVYFDNLAQFDAWRATLSGPISHSDGVLKYVPRTLRPQESFGKGKLLVNAHPLFLYPETYPVPGIP